MYWSS